MRLPHLLGIGMLTLALLVSGGSSKDNEVNKDQKKDEKKKDDKKKSDLPGGFKGIELTKDQLEKIGIIRADYKPKIDDLAKKLADAKKMEVNDILKVLTADQRKIYDENTAKKKDKKKEEKKEEKKEKKDDKK